MDPSKSSRTKVMSSTPISLTKNALKSMSDSQAVTRSKYQKTTKSGWSFPSMFPLPIHQGPCCAGRLIGNDPSRNVMKEAGIASENSPNILGLTKEIEELSKENIQLKEESFAADFDYMNVLEQLEYRENEIEALQTELDQLSDQIASSNAKEQEYLRSAESCVNLENQIRSLQEQLMLHRRDFEQLSSIHAACPSSQEINSAVDQAKALYQAHLGDAIDQLSARDELIADLEINIAKKDAELQKMSEELFQQQTDYNLKEQACEELHQHVGSMENLIKDREKLIGNMRKLMVRKNMKINLLLTRIEELEVKLNLCQKQLLKGARETQSSPSGFPQNGCPDFDYLRSTWSSEDIRKKDQKAVQCYWLCEPKKSIELRGSDSSAGIMETLRMSRLNFDQVQSQIEEIRRGNENSEMTRELIKARVSREKRLSKIIGTSENDRQITRSRILSFKKTLKNLEDLENFIAQTETVQVED